jgi:hypothetical protein
VKNERDYVIGDVWSDQKEITILTKTLKYYKTARESGRR